MHRVVPRLASAVAASAAVSAVSPAPAATEAFHAPDRLEEFQNFTRSPKSSSSLSNLLFNSTSSVEWDYVLKEEAQENHGILGPVPAADEVAEATNCVFECLQGEQSYGQLDFHPSLPDSLCHSWPEADASMVASEQAIEKAREAMGASESNFLSIQGIVAPTSITLTRSMGPFREAIDLLQQQPEAAKRVVASLALDKNVWNAFQQNSELRAFISQNTKVVIEDAGDVIDEQRSGQTESQNSGDTPANVQESGSRTFVQKIVEKLATSVKSFMSIMASFMDSLKGSSEQSSSKSDDDDEPPILEVPPTVAGIFVLVVLVIMAVVSRRK